MSEYYRPRNTNLKWYDIFTEQLEDGELPEEVLDSLCESACGIKIPATDTCQAYARHIHAHLIAAFKLGQKCNKNI